MTEGTAFRDTQTSTVKINKPPLILSNQLAMKKQRRRQIRNQEALPSTSMSQQQYGSPYVNILPSLNTGGRAGSAMYDTPVSGMEDEQQLATLPYAIVPMDQPIMMVNYPPRAPIHLQAPHRIQPVRYRSYGDRQRQMMGGSSKYLVTTDSGAENVYYQFVAPPQESQPRRPMNKRSLNAVENWAWLTQRLVELEQFKLQERFPGDKQPVYGESMEYDVDDDEEQLVLDHEYDEESDMYRPRVLPKRGGRFKPKRGVSQLVLVKWRRLTQKLLQQDGGGWGGLQQVLTGSKPTEGPSTTAKWRTLLLKMADQKSGLCLNPLGEPDLLKAFKEKEEKRLKVEVYRRWNILIRKALQRVASLDAASNLERWTRLLKKAEQAGHVNLKGLAGLSKTVVRDHKMKVNARWLRLTKALLKNAKLSQV